MKARDGAFDMDDTASHNQVVARNFQEKFAIQELGTRPFDLCPTVEWSRTVTASRRPSSNATTAALKTARLPNCR